MSGSVLADRHLLHYVRWGESEKPMQRTRVANWVSCADSEPLRMEAFIAGRGYTPHRHDSYVFALTLHGVQSFQYRGSERHSLPGGVIVVHPDELHDCHAGTQAGFRYRALAVEPCVIQQMLGGKELPFLEGGTSTDRRLLQALTPLLKDFERPLEELECQDVLYGDAPSRRTTGERLRKQRKFLAPRRSSKTYSQGRLAISTGSARRLMRSPTSSLSLRRAKLPA